MKLVLLFSLFSTLLAGVCKAQQKIIEHPKLFLLNAGTTAWPVKLTKQWFEGDTAYILTFRNSKFKSFKIGEQGFFKFELKGFRKALQTAISVSYNSEIDFREGTITISETKGRRGIECNFRTGTGIFRAKESVIKKIIIAIGKE